MKATPTRRVMSVLAVAGLVALLATASRFACIGRSCERATEVGSTVPFCRLPERTRSDISRGFRDGRSPDVIAVTGPTTTVAGGTAFPGGGPSWPSVGATGRVPLIFHGTGVATGAPVPDGVTLDRVAPTIAEIIGLRRPFPEVRSGEAIDGVSNGRRPRLVVQVVVKGVGSRDLSTSAALRGLLDRGAGSMGARVGSEPADPAAVLTTIGTGGSPSRHGYVGTLMRDDSGDLRRAWGPGTPQLVIAALGDDLDDQNDQASLVGLVARSRSDRGLIGGTWYLEHDRDILSISRNGDLRSIERRVLEHLSSGFGADDVPDLLGVVVEGARLDVERFDRFLGSIRRAAGRATDDRGALVVTATGAAEGPPDLSADEIEDAVDSHVGAEVVQATTPGGLYLDQEVLARHSISEEVVLAAVSRIQTADGTRVFEDVFTSIAVTFERYC